LRANFAIGVYEIWPGHGLPGFRGAEKYGKVLKSMAQRPMSTT
jgi:hypothetical protein